MNEINALSSRFQQQSMLSPLGGAQRLPQGVRREQLAYNQVMGRAETAKGTPEQRAREAAQQLVAITFVRPVLEQLRESSNAAPPFAPSSGEKQFRSFLDAKLADEITAAAQFPLVDRIARDMARQPVQPEPMTRGPTGGAA